MSEQPTTPDTIRLTGVSATGYHGVFDHERREGQTFVVDLVVELDTRRAAATDDLVHTLDYGTVAEQVVGVLAGEPADLIETVAERIAATVLAHPQVHGVEVTVHKPQAPITVPFGDVEVRVRRDRNRLPAAEPLAADAQPWQPPVEAGTWQSDTAADSAELPTTDGRPTTGPIRVSGTGAPATAVLPAVPVDLAGSASAGAALAGAALAGSLDPGAPDEADVVTGQTPVTEDSSAAAAVAGLTGGSAPVPVVQQSGDVLDLAPAEPTEVVLALGSNLGTAQETLRSAVAAIADIPGVELLEVSALARTAPVGGPEQPDYLNAVLIARTTLAPRALLHATGAIEQEHGRERLVHWGPRTLDIDIIAFGELSVVTDDLDLPHPRAHERAFVLQPWAQVRPDAVLHGLGGGPVAQLAATAPDRDGVRWLALDWLTQPVPAAPETDVPAAEPEHDPLRDHPALFDIPAIRPEQAP
ncbi:2-amino-4-hydroxy-6-hydroxymethyldihydropteridine diphosphokinase [Cellulomonas sp. RIT-PI-Y]|uniref:2-amino-4-hydroxy-6- hydroxymethyldihydropteridine diphosphokinase n=1 Tax=Cellulomonas sp. RIT-PI-Y TaxID=3035297 RepID=UPI0021D86346|nr:2-amino-4-hydroxy-6-hydroxymethyldihydropteridine diphosphokinase [Cellulomonas sp. RIT-PI-Y]